MFADLARLFSSPLRLKVIKFFALQPDERFALADVVSALGAPRKSVQAELRSALRLGILQPKVGRDGRMYMWNSAYPRAQSIQQFVIDATTPDDKVVADIFRRLGVSTVVAAGILAQESRGDVDLLLVTRRPKDARLALAVKKLESLSAVPIRYAVMEVEEYKTRTMAYDRMLRDIFDFRHRVILGKA